MPWLQRGQSAARSRAVRASPQPPDGLCPANAEPPPPDIASPRARSNAPVAWPAQPERRQAGARGPAPRLLSEISCRSIANTGTEGENKNNKGPAVRGVSCSQRSEQKAAGSSRGSNAPGARENQNRSAKPKRAPEAGHRATQSRRQHVQGTAARWCIAPGSAQQTADASGKKVRRSAWRDRTALARSVPRQTSYSMTWRSAGCAAPSMLRGSYSMETSRLRWRVLRTTLMRPATCAAGFAAVPRL